VDMFIRAFYRKPQNVRRIVLPAAGFRQLSAGRLA